MLGLQVVTTALKPGKGRERTPAKPRVAAEVHASVHFYHLLGPQVEIDALKPGEVKERTPAKPQRQTYYARRYGQRSMGGSRLVGSLQVSLLCR